MSFFATIHDAARDQQLRFLIIGGLAINHYGYNRETADLDLFVSQTDRAAWLKCLSDLRYTVYHDGGSFIQFTPPHDNAWPVDLMLVAEKTFGLIFNASVDADLYGIKTRVPALEHLIALKLHALKHTRIQRFLKDFLDVENLIRINRLDLRSENLRQIFARHGTPELYDQLSRALAPN